MTRVALFFCAAAALCNVAEAQSNSCQYSHDGDCDDGRTGSLTSLCSYGTDAADCAGGTCPAHSHPSSGE